MIGVEQAVGEFLDNGLDFALEGFQKDTALVFGIDGYTVQRAQ